MIREAKSKSGLQQLSLLLQQGRFSELESLRDGF